MQATMTIPTWMLGLICTLLITFVGGLIAHVRTFTKLATTVEHLSTAMLDINKNIHSLSTSVNDLNRVVALLAKDVERIDELDNDVRKIKNNLHLD